MSKKISGNFKSGYCNKGIITNSNMPNQKKRARHKHKPEDDYILKMTIESDDSIFELKLEDPFIKIWNFIKELICQFFIF